MIKVKQMKSSSGNAIANQYVLYSHNAKYFQSYNTLVAKKVDSPHGTVTVLQEGYWDMYSTTTNKYLNNFLGTSGIAEIRENVKNGKYEVRRFK